MSDTALDTTGCDIASCDAAFPMLPDCTTANRICRSRSLNRRPMRSLQGMSVIHSERAMISSYNSIIRLCWHQLSPVAARRLLLAKGNQTRMATRGEGHDDDEDVRFGDGRAVLGIK